MSLSVTIDSVLASYAEAKVEIGELTDASQELLHVHIGLLIFVASSLILKKKFRSPIPLTLVFVFALANEVVDWINLPTVEPIGVAWDIANTVFWPTILFLLARRWTS